MRAGGHGSAGALDGVPATCPIGLPMGHVLKTFEVCGFDIRLGRSDDLRIWDSQVVANRIQR
jgi:hypothetical protein